MTPPLSNMWTGIISPFTVRQVGMLFASHTQSYPKRSMLALGSDLVLQVTVSSAMDLLQ